MNLKDRSFLFHYIMTCHSLKNCVFTQSTSTNEQLKRALTDKIAPNSVPERVVYYYYTII